MLLIVISLMAVAAYLQEPVRANELLYKSAHTVARVFMAVGIICLVWRVRPLARSRILLFMAPITYELYLVHMKVLPIIGEASGWEFCWRFLVFVGVSVVGAWVLNWVDRVILKKVVR